MFRNLLLISLTFLISTSLFSQVRRSDNSKLPKETIQNITYRVVDSDGTKFVMLSYRNAKYQHITDIESIAFSTSSEIDEFLESLKEMVNEPKKSELTLQSKEWLMAFILNKLIVGESDFSSYTYVRRKDFEKISSTLKSFKKYLE